MPVTPAIIPCLRYRDAPAAIAFLCRAFGFAVHADHRDPDDRAVVVHAQLVRTGQMIMVSSAVESDYAVAAPMVTAADAGGNTQAPYVTIDDVDSHAANAAAAGADIFLAPHDADYGGRHYSARDPEGNVWSFGSYDPFA